ncbi:MAG: TIGR03013 family XrtA/PEP-CTERM system glycosyltransferase [Thermodesulfobacteriota bacterium]|nr:TIGR03013 family XrtA/PEP-CTERM system glycosyltransferase [Thermodesulfobacteriota bacterium]
MPYIFNKYYPLRNLVFVFGEGALIFLVINSVFIGSAGFLEYKEFFWLYMIRAMAVTLVFQVCFYYFDLYDLKVIPIFYDHILQVLQTFGFGCIILAFIYFMVPFLTITTKVFWGGLCAIGLVVFFWRFLYFKIIERRMFVQNIALIGTGQYAAEIIDEIKMKKDAGFKIRALVGEKNPDLDIGKLPVYSTITELRSLCELKKIEKIVVALDEKRGMPLHELIPYKFLGVEIVDGARCYEALTGKLPVERMHPSWMVFSDGFYVSRMKRVFKRILDLAVSVPLLVLAVPIFIISALAIKIESPGEVFYRQERVGENDIPFTLIKFRSMRADAEKDGAVWAATDDDRITRYGKIIRKLRFDELPQLVNVLKGEMSLVGPRPERPVFVNELEKKIPFYANRHLVKPGLTGWAQINYSYGASEEDALRKLEYDLYYIKNLSLGLDILCIVQTIKVVLFQKGSR